MIAQLVGAVVGSLALLGMSSTEQVASTANTYGGNTGVGLLSEFLLTAIFVLVILASTRWAPRGAPFVISFTLAAVHFAGIPFSGSSVNPARSFGPALVSGTWGELWLYVVAPLLGGAAAFGLHKMFPVAEES